MIAKMDTNNTIEEIDLEKQLKFQVMFSNDTVELITEKNIC